MLLESLNWTLKYAKIPASWKEAVISMIQKEGKNKELCKSYRPISILNVDNKVFTSIISKRLEQFLADLINEDQTGFIKSRQMQDNIRQILHIVEQINKQHLSGALISLDAKTACDRVSWSFLYKILERFSFNNQFISCIQAFYSDPATWLKINGCLIGSFKLYRSIWQGCCLSSSLFALFIEPLAQNIRQNNELERVTKATEEHRIGLFAGDVITYLKYPNLTFPKLLTILESFGQMSGYKLNSTETQILCLNCSQNCVIGSKYKLKWDTKSIKYLGILITQNLTTCMRLTIIP